MKPATIIGIVLILIGIIGFAVGGFSFTHEHQDAKLGPLQVEHKQTDTVPIPLSLAALPWSAASRWWSWVCVAESK